MKARFFAAAAVGFLSLVLVGAAGANAAPSQVVSGLGHSCAIVGSNVWCWGDNTNGQLGQGVSGGSSSTPEQVTGLTSVTQISAGTYQTCALKSDQTVWCWGILGQALPGSQPTPAPSPFLPGTWAAVAAGQFDVCGLTTDLQHIVCGGDGGRSVVGSHAFPLPVATDARGQYMFGVGSYEACAGLTDGTVWCFGDNGFGGPATPALASGPFGGSVTSVTAEYSNDACATFSDGSAWCWSDNGSSSGFTQMLAPGSGATEVVAQNGHFCALVTGGGATCWSDGGVVPGLTGATQISTSGLGGGCALVGGGIKCWGGNGFGQLGDGTNTPSASPVDVTGFASAPPDSDLALTNVPADITVGASSPTGGAVVTYTAPTAIDEDVVPVFCAPASGSTFPVGMTTVTCTATEPSDANSPASAHFSVTVTPFTITGKRSGPLTIGPGATVVLDGATVSGPVTIQAGGSLIVLNGKVTGPLSASSAGVLALCGSTITGPVTLTGGHGSVTVGAAHGCGGNTITGPVKLTGNTGGLSFVGNTVTGPATITGNSGGFSYSGNHISGPANVSGNS